MSAFFTHATSVYAVVALQLLIPVRSCARLESLTDPCSFETTFLAFHDDVLLGRPERRHFLVGHQVGVEIVRRHGRGVTEIPLGHVEILGGGEEGAIKNFRKGMNEAEKIEDDLGDLDLGDSESSSEEDPEEEPDTKDQDHS